MIKLLLDKKIFASSDAQFCHDTAHTTMAATHAILAMIWFCHLSTGFATKICTYINASGRAQ